MPTPESPDERSHYWQEQVNAWQTSGQSQRAFCQTHDLNYPRFGYWLRKFRQQDQQTVRATTAFVPAVPCASVGGLTLVLCNGLELRGILPEHLLLVEQLVSRLG